MHWECAECGGHTLGDRRPFVCPVCGIGGSFFVPAHSDVGIELGFFPGDGSLNLAVMNGAPGLVRDVDGVRAYFARTEIRRRLGPVNIAGGLSGLAVDEEEFE
ncbi:MAG: hypothetical protein KKI08_17920, partial [Armatimonadetes bacterium]|nr:hypothetical protein [Armatimonadota bacterium]